MQGVFANLMRNYGGVVQEEKGKDEVSVERVAIVEKPNTAVISKDESNAGKQLMRSEDKQTGGVSGSVFVAFAIAMGGAVFCSILLFTLVMTQVSFFFFFFYFLEIKFDIRSPKCRRISGSYLGPRTLSHRWAEQHTCGFISASP